MGYFIRLKQTKKEKKRKSKKTHVYYSKLRETGGNGSCIPRTSSYARLCVQSDGRWGRVLYVTKENLAKFVKKVNREGRKERKVKVTKKRPVFFPSHVSLTSFPPFPGDHAGKRESPVQYVFPCPPATLPSAPPSLHPEIGIRPVVAFLLPPLFLLGNYIMYFPRRCSFVSRPIYC